MQATLAAVASSARTTTTPSFTFAVDLVTVP